MIITRFNLSVWDYLAVTSDHLICAIVIVCQSVSSVASRQHLRSVSRGLLVVPRHRLSGYGRRAFSVVGPAM